MQLRAQAPAGAAETATVKSVGTVKSVSSSALTVGTDKGDAVNVTLPANVRVLQLAPGSTDLKTAQPGTVSDIVQGDRVLVTGRAGDNGGVLALRVILMKSGAIAQNNEARQQDWQRRGSGGVVESIDPAAHSLVLGEGARRVTVTTTPSTVFRRYAPGSVKFEDATLSKIDSIQPGDQARVRGDKATDGSTVAAEEVISGAFRNVAGLITKVDAGASTFTLNDLATKKPVTVAVAPDSDLRSLPPEMAARFAARARGNAAGVGAGARGAAVANGSTPGGRPPYAPGAAPASGQASASDTGDRAAEGHAAGRGGDLSQIIARLPKATLAELKTGEAVMVVASGDSTSTGGLTAVTVLSGVEPLLAASPQGGANSFSISPWNLGGGGEGGEGAGPQ